MTRDLAMTLRELRSYTGKTQVAAAAATAMTQPELSRLERRDDFLLSTLRRYVAALGGTLDVIVRLGSSSIRITDGERAARPWELADVREAIATLAELPSWLPPQVAGLDAAVLRRRVDGCGAFALVEHVWHLRDIDVEGFAVRLRRTLCEDAPRLPDLDGDALARERAYLEQPLAPALRALLASRARSLATLRALTAQELRRPAHLEGAGDLTLGDIILRWRTHDLGHRVELERLSGALRAW